ncbi:MAG TPA: TVP38/TMEM64 family protein [Desulfobacteria bacterium]|nr:TVP38/TMEM64 family protein [Desulfobacteria bacterium]
MNQNMWKWLFRAIFVLVITGLYLLVPGLKQEVNKAAGILAVADIKGMKEYLAGFGIWGPIVSMLLMVLQGLAAPLPAFVITFANAWIWGWAWGALISWSGAMIAAVLCFYLARWFGRPLVKRMVGAKALDISDSFFKRYGKYTVLIARLIPIVSFDLISYAAGLTNLTLWQFVWATGLGQLPATIIYSFLGEHISNSAKYGFMAFSGFVSLLVLSLVIRKRMENKLRENGDSNVY